MFMPLHPALQEIVRITNESNNPPLSQTPLAEIRKGPERLKLLAGEPPHIEKTVNHIIQTPQGKLLLRLYYPEDKKKLPLVLYFHPGGFVKGEVSSHDPVCRSLALASGCIIASVNYALAPEHPFPAATQDAKAALTWISTHKSEIEADGRIAIGGENAGGNLAAVLTHEIRREGGVELACQVLIYPQTDLTCNQTSHREFAKGYLLEKESIDWYKRQYLSLEANLKDPRISPLWAKAFDHLPPALIITAEFDPLRDEGEAYATKLKAAGTPVTLRRYDGMVHGFFQMGGVVDEGNLAIQEVGAFLKKHL